MLGFQKGNKWVGRVQARQVALSQLVQTAGRNKKSRSKRREECQHSGNDEAGGVRASLNSDCGEAQGEERGVRRKGSKGRTGT